MNYTSLALSFRIGLAFHALNNEGSSGTNVMEPRRISVGGAYYDGISGEMVRRHVLENLVKVAKSRKLPLSKDGEGLMPDRAKSIIKSYLSGGQDAVPQENNVYQLAPQHLPLVTKVAIEQCTITDIGGYLAAFEGSEGVKGATPKRDSVFEASWLISEAPAVVEFTQHAAYRPTGQHNLFTQNMRAATYGGVARLDLGRVGYNDWAWLDGDMENPHLDDSARNLRAASLVDAWEQWLLSPSGAKQAGWLQHTGLLEGVIVLSNFGPAPFRSPIEVVLEPDNERIQKNTDYIQQLERLGEVKKDRYQVLTFNDQASLAEAFDGARDAIGIKGVSGLSEDSVWIRASYACHSFHYRMPDTVAISSVNPAMPSPLTAQMAMLASYLREGMREEAQQLLELMPLEVRIRPPEGAIVYRSIMRYVRPPKKANDTDSNTGSSYKISPHFREFALLQGNLEVFVRVSQAHKVLVEEALERIPYLGAKDSLVTCLDIEKVEVPPKDCASPIEHYQPGVEDVLVMQFASLLDGPKNKPLTLTGLIPSQRDKAHYDLQSYVVPGRMTSQGNVKLYHRT